MSAAASRLQELVDAGVLAEDLAAEIRRLYDVEDAHEQLREEISNLRRDSHRTAVLNGDLRQRLLSAERRLEQIPAKAIAAAKNSAYWHGEGFIRIHHHSRGNYSAEHVATTRVTVRP